MYTFFNFLLITGLFLPPALHAEYFALPAAVRLEGVGPVYGVAAGANNLSGERVSLIAGAAFGAAQAQGALIRDVPMGLAKGGLSFGFANLSSARFNTSYVRGLESSTVFEQEISGQIFGAGAEYKLSSDLKLELGLVQSTVRLDNYYLDGERVIRPITNGYHPVKTNSKILQLKYDTTPIGAGAALATAEGRTGQSDTLTATYSLNGQIPLADKLSFHSRLRWSDAYITKQQKKYLTAAEVRGALNTGCTTVQCQTLEDSLAAYIARNNLHGTAVPLGGNQGVRAFDEFSLRAAHTRLVAFELRLDLLPWLQFVPSYELGWSRDQTKDLYEKSVQSYGVGLRGKVKDLAVRLAMAQTHDQSAWFLTLERK